MAPDEETPAPAATEPAAAMENPAPPQPDADPAPPPAADPLELIPAPVQEDTQTAGGALGEAEEGDDAEKAEFEFELGATVYLFERNVDPETSEVLDGYQAPKQGTITKITEETDRIDVRTGGTDSPAVTSHDVPHKSQAEDGGNYWSETAD